MSIKIETKMHTVTKKTSVIRLTGTDIRHMLGDRVPSNVRASIYFSVPGGADWSNTSIDIDSDTPITVEWEIIEESSE